MITFKYRKEKSRKGNDVYRPVADVEFGTKDGEWIEEHPYIDSGADITLIPLSFGKLLGFEVKNQEIEELQGVGGRGIPIVYRQILMRIGRHGFEVDVAWALIEEVPPLLGRKGVFDNFHVNFKQDEGVIEFIKVPQGA